MSTTSLPDRFDGVAALEDFMTAPSPELTADLAALPGDILILGVAGKMGPTLARLAKRAAPHKRVVGIARFSDAATRTALEAAGVETIVCDLLDRRAVEALPKLPNVVYMAAMKFGASGNPALTWAMNVHAPACGGVVSASRIVASDGCSIRSLPCWRGATRRAPLRRHGRLRANSSAASACSSISRKPLHARSHPSLNYSSTAVTEFCHVAACGGVPIDSPWTRQSIWQGDSNAVALRCCEYDSTDHAIKSRAETLRTLARAGVWTALRTWTNRSQEEETG